MKSTEFKKTVTRNFSGFIRNLGFKGSGFNFIKTEEDHIQVVTIQPSSSGGKFCIEIGVYYTFMNPLSENHILDLKKCKTWDCEISDRLTPEGKSDFWWNFPESEVLEEEIFTDIKKLFKEKAVPYFEKYKNLKQFIDNVSIEKIENKETKNFYPATQMRTALFVARLKEHFDNKKDAILYSDYGLSKIEGNKGSGLIEYFERIIKNCS